MPRRLGFALCAVLAVAGCTTMPDKAAIEKMPIQERIKMAEAGCRRSLARLAGEYKSELSQFMGVPYEKTTEEACRRIVRGVATGRITEKDFIKLRQNGASAIFTILRKAG